MQIDIHPAPGLGELLPGWFVVPQNPIIHADSTPIKASIVAKADGAPVKIASLGELLPGYFTVPENPVRAAMGMGRLGCGTCGMGQTPAPGPPNLMGSLANVSGSLSSWLQGTMIDAIPNWALVGGAVLLYFLMAPGGSEYRSARAASRGYRRLARQLA